MTDMLEALGWIVVMLAGTGAIVWGAELFAEHLAAASVSPWHQRNRSCAPSGGRRA